MRGDSRGAETCGWQQAMVPTRLPTLPTVYLGRQFLRLHSLTMRGVLRGTAGCG